MRITAIKQDAAGWKIIAAVKVHEQAKYKPFIGSSVFFEYKDGLLKDFGDDRLTTHDNFKAALKHILSL